MYYGEPQRRRGWKKPRGWEIVKTRGCKGHLKRYGEMRSYCEGWVKRGEFKQLKKEGFMSKEKLPKQYLQIKKRHANYFNAVEELGKVVKQEGPLDERTAHLIQLAASATVHSEGAVHSHVRRA